MRQGKREFQVNLDKFLTYKHLVEKGQVQKKDACLQMGISLYLFNKWCEMIDAEGQRRG